MPTIDDRRATALGLPTGCTCRELATSTNDNPTPNCVSISDLDCPRHGNYGDLPTVCRPAGELLEAIHVGPMGPDEIRDKAIGHALAALGRFRRDPIEDADDDADAIAAVILPLAARIATWIEHGDQAPAGKFTDDECARILRDVAAHPRRDLIEEIAEVTDDLDGEDGGGSGKLWHLANAHALVAALPGLRLDEAGAWTVAKIDHDETRLVGPHVHGRMVHRGRGASDPDHTRVYAAQLLAAADAAESAAGVPARICAPCQAGDHLGCSWNEPNSKQCDCPASHDGDKAEGAGA